MGKGTNIANAQGCTRRITFTRFQLLLMYHGIYNSVNIAKKRVGGKTMFPALNTLQEESVKLAA